MKNYDLVVKILETLDTNLETGDVRNENITASDFDVDDDRLFNILNIMVRSGLISNNNSDGLSFNTYKLYMDKIKITMNGIMFLENMKK